MGPNQVSAEQVWRVKTRLTSSAFCLAVRSWPLRDSFRHWVSCFKGSSCGCHSMLGGLGGFAVRGRRVCRYCEGFEHHSKQGGGRDAQSEALRGLRGAEGVLLVPAMVSIAHMRKFHRRNW